MKLRPAILLLLAFTLNGNFAVAQQTVEKEDTIRGENSIEGHQGKSRFTGFLYKYFYKRASPESEKYKTKRIGYKNPAHQLYEVYEGKIIRHISIETLDPFKNSIADTIEIGRNFIARNGNKYHIKSKETTIRNQLLIKESQRFDSLLVKESERLIRSNEYIRDVSFRVTASSEYSDSVDIIIRTLDRWSIIPKASISSTRSNLSLSENNLLGWGHVFQNNVILYDSSQDNSYQTSYFIPTIGNTFINGTFSYGTAGNHDYDRGITFNRPFFSPLTKWAGGAAIMQQYKNDSVRINYSELVPLSFKNTTQDYWAGYALNLSGGNPKYHRATNFVSTARFLRIRYIDKPTRDTDPLNFYTNENFYLASIGISTRVYVQDKYIFKYGITEDIPIGKVFELTGGYQHKNIDRFYLSAQFSQGNYYAWGYLSTNIEYGTFLNELHPEQGAFSADAVYFTKLIVLGKWKFRQFIKPQITIGINGQLSDRLIFNTGQGLDGLANTRVTGTRRLLLTSQTQSYAPWNFIGFRFGPFMTYSLGILGDKEIGLNHGQIYSQIGLGVLIKNENLILNAFQLSISFYPLIPGLGQNVFKMNSFKTTDFGLRDFEIGKPSKVEFW